MLAILCSLTVAAVILEGPDNLPGKLFYLQTRSALLNVTSVGFLGLVLMYFAAINLSGPTLATIMTMIGFSFFGNTLYNSVPVIIGILAGTIYVVVVDVTASWHGGMDLYNNGFAGGLTASLIISVILWLNANRILEDFA